MGVMVPGTDLFGFNWLWLWFVVTLVVEMREESEEYCRVQQQQGTNKSWVTTVHKQQLGWVYKDQEELELKQKI